MKNKKKGVLIAVVVIALIVAAVAAVCINKKAGDSGKLKEGQTETTSFQEFRRSKDSG